MTASDGSDEPARRSRSRPPSLPQQTLSGQRDREPGDRRGRDQRDRDRRVLGPLPARTTSRSCSGRRTPRPARRPPATTSSAPPCRRRAAATRWCSTATACRSGTRRRRPVDGWCVFDVDSVVSGTVSFDSLVDNPDAVRASPAQSPRHDEDRADRAEHRSARAAAAAERRLPRHLDARCSRAWT